MEEAPRQTLEEPGHAQSGKLRPFDGKTLTAWAVSNQPETCTKPRHCRSFTAKVHEQERDSREDLGSRIVILAKEILRAFGSKSEMHSRIADS
jgi:hypothetical protein